MKYKAFISYSQSHREFAAALQAALELFGRPWYEQNGLTLFRDNTGLSATPELWVDIQKALDHSEYFLLLASPEAAGSHWVCEEISYWLNHRGASHLVIALLNGQTLWNIQERGFQFPDTTALTEIIRRAFPEMPLYVDLRGLEHDEWRLSHAGFCDRVATISSALQQKKQRGTLWPARLRTDCVRGAAVGGRGRARQT
jgi:hypothetical protein